MRCARSLQYALAVLATVYLTAVSGAAAANTAAFVPLKVSTSIQKPTVTFAGAVETRDWSLSKVAWSALVTKIPVRLGDTVKKGDLLAVVEIKYIEASVDYADQIIAILRAQLDQVLKQEARARNDLGRNRKLASQGFVAVAKTEKIEAAVLEVENAKQTLRGQLAEVERQKAAQEENLRSASYFAPVDGVITQLLVDPAKLSGAYMANYDEVIARIDRPGVYLVRTAALDTQLGGVRPGAAAMVMLEGGNGPIPGRVKAIVPEKSSAPGAPPNAAGPPSFQVITEFELPGPLLTKGLPAKVEISTSAPVRGLFVPWNALSITSAGAFVSVQDNVTGWTEKRVRIGRRLRHVVQVTHGVKDGDVIKSFLW